MGRMPEVDPPERVSENRTRILDCAAEEFAEYGFAGARVERIMRCAGANKQLLYYYFGSKSELYEAVLDRMADVFRPSRGQTGATDFAQFFEAVVGSAFGPENAVWRRLLAWEGLEHGAQERPTIAREQARSASYRAETELIAGAVARGDLPPGVEPRALLLLLIFASVVPDALPQVTRMITGRGPSDPALRQTVESTLRALLFPTTRAA
jgi:TetR/AcrR family transcriptional regulator